MSNHESLKQRYEFVLYFDVRNGNPNGDPDAGNLPRLDPETNHGLVSDVCLKRKIRNYVMLAKADAPGFEIYMREGATLNNEHKRAWRAVVPDEKTDALNKLPKDEAKARQLTRWMCSNFWDIRTFGAVMTTGVNAGQVRGPVQIAFASSVEPVLPLEISITRLAATKEADAEAKGKTMGRKHIIPYGLYRAHGFVSAPLASHPTKGTGFSNDDLQLLFTALRDMFEHDRSASRGEMSTRRLIAFRHASEMGNAHAHELFARVKTWRVVDGKSVALGSKDAEEAGPARGFADYAITVDIDQLPTGIEVVDLSAAHDAIRVAV